MLLFTLQPCYNLFWKRILFNPFFDLAVKKKYNQGRHQFNLNQRHLSAFNIQGETELSFRQKPRTKQLRDEVILFKKDISLKDNSVSYCICIKVFLC